LKKNELKRDIFAVCEDKQNSESQADLGPHTDFFLTNPTANINMDLNDSAKIIEEEGS
jgi:hypothetical protein